jgi:N-acetylglucosamine kinase-like BadF-type ATPase
MSLPLVLAVDGGNSKTDVALVRADGTLLGATRGPGSSPQDLGVAGSVALIEELLARVHEEHGVYEAADVGQVLLAGLDTPREEEELERMIRPRGLARQVTVGNDVLAVLREGTPEGVGVALVCGAGMNCVGVGPDGRRIRYPALGDLTGDWGGGLQLGVAALGAAVRGADGRGSHTLLERAVPDVFALADPDAVWQAIHFGDLDESGLVDVAPAVFAAADQADPVARALVDRLGAELLDYVRATVERLGLAGEAFPVVIGGGLLRADTGGVVRAAVAEGLAAIAPRATLTLSATPPIVGAALLGLDDLGASAAAQRRLRNAYSDGAAVPQPTS